MSGWNMPDGCTQADLDRAFDNLGEPDEPEVVRLDCGHWDTEDHADKVGDRIVCGNCYRAEAERVAGDTQAFDRLKASLAKARRCGCGPDYLDPDCTLHSAAAVRRNPPICPECNEPSGVTGQHKEGCSRA